MMMKKFCFFQQNDGHEPGEIETDEENDEDCDNDIDQDSPAGSQVLTPLEKEAKSEQEALKILSDNPHLGNVLMKMIKKGVREEIESNANKSPVCNWVKECEIEPPVPSANLVGADKHLDGAAIAHQAATNRGNVVKGLTTPNNKGNKVVSGIIKSPSDTTIYAPALRRVAIDQEKPNEIMERISNFIEEIHIETIDHAASPNIGKRFISESKEKADGRAEVQPRPGPSHEIEEEEEIEDENMLAARNLLLENEKFRAEVEPPPKGRCNLNEFDKIQCDSDDQDDDQFFHLACHVDQMMKGKIERGEFVELEKLLPKKKSFAAEEGRLEWISKDGLTFLVPAQDRELKITGFKKWDQAFRVYASIYCNANPSRAGEIWQYIHMISSAATSYQWDNVAYYDTVFRQMMAERPGRKWSKTYVQLWQLALRDPVQKGSNYQGYNSNGSNQGVRNGNGKQEKKHKDWRDNCC